MTLYRVGWRHLARHPWQTILMILGITLGVAVAVAVDLANASASRAFDLSAEAVAGKATHQITGGPAGLDEEIYTLLKTTGTVKDAAPVITSYVSSPQIGNISLQLFGLDPFADAPFRSYLGNQAPSSNSPQGPGLNQPSILDLTNFLSQPGAILVSESLATRYSLEIGQAIDLAVAGKNRQAVISGILRPEDALSQRALESLVISDIATAQELTGSPGRLDRIDLLLPADPKQDCSTSGEQPQGCLAAIGALLPADARINTVAARTGTIEQMTNAFRVNLTALSLLALVVGMFLIYNTMTFSVVQRRGLFGALRCLGATRNEVFSLVLSEAAIVGIIGSTFGLVFGVILGQGAVRLVTQTINDLYFVLTIRGIQIPLESLVKGAILGIVITILTAAPPAWEAASTPPRAALSRSSLESKANRMVRTAGNVGMLVILSGALVLLSPARSLVISFAATFMVIIGCAMLTPLATKYLMRWSTPPLGRILATMGRMAPRNVITSLSRTSIAVMALMIAISVTIGINIMVSSFRQTVVNWLDETLQGDIYISAPGLTATAPSVSLEPEIVKKLRDWPGASRVDVLRSVNVDSPDGPINVAATDNTDVATERLFLSTEGPVNGLQDRLKSGEVLVSEPLARRLNLPGKKTSITLFTDRGQKAFPIAGIYYDYASTQGTLIMPLAVYQSNWNDPVITAVSLRLNPGNDVDQTVQEIQNELSANQQILVRSNRALREEVLVVFDRTFSITNALQLLATLVAFIGILSALLSLELERQRELGILRSIGMTARQLWELVFLETGLIGAVAGLLAMPTGYVLSLILIYIINRRSFGWTLQMQLSFEPFLNALLLGIIAALLAGVIPAYRMGRMITSEALRAE